MTTATDPRLAAAWRILRPPGSRLTLADALAVPPLAAVLRAYVRWRLRTGTAPAPRIDRKRLAAGDTD